MEPTTFGLTADQLAKLFRIGSDTKGASRRHGAQKSRRSLLDQWLDRDVLDELVEGLQGRDTPSRGGQVRDLLLGPGTDLAILRKLKVLYKERIAMAEDKPEHDVATTLYYAAIAAGLVYHGQRLSSYSPRQLGKALTDLSKKAWMRQDLRALFTKAGQACLADE